MRNVWCGREDSNLHGIATASPSSWCVCQFRHYRTVETTPFYLRETALARAGRFEARGAQKPGATKGGKPRWQRPDPVGINAADSTKTKDNDSRRITAFSAASRRAAKLPEPAARVSSPPSWKHSAAQTHRPAPPLYPYATPSPWRIP